MSTTSSRALGPASSEAVDGDHTAVPSIPANEEEMEAPPKLDQPSEPIQYGPFLLQTWGLAASDGLYFRSGLETSEASQKL